MTWVARIDYRHVRYEPDLIEPLWRWPTGASVLIVGELPRESVMVRRPPDCYGAILKQNSR